MKYLIFGAMLLLPLLTVAQFKTKINSSEQAKLQENPKEFLANLGEQRLIGYLAESETKVEYYALIFFNGKELAQSKPLKGEMFPGTILFPGNILFPGTILDKMESGPYKLIFFIRDLNGGSKPMKSEFSFKL